MRTQTDVSVFKVIVYMPEFDECECCAILSLFFMMLKYFSVFFKAVFGTFMVNVLDC